MSPDSQRPTNVDPALRDQAIDWFVRMASGLATDDDRAALAHWRNADAEHERAWRRVADLGQRMEASKSAVTPSVARATLRRAAFDRQNRRRTLKLLAGAGIGFGVIGSVALTQRDPVLLRSVLADYRTGTGERRTLVLADGTRLTLNTRTAVDVSFDARHRAIALHDGEIEVVTAADALQRPFAVVTQDGALSPLGTRFTVRRLDADAHTRIAVSEGRVQIESVYADGKLIVEAGEQARFSAAGIIQEPEPQSAEDGAWTRGMLAAQRMRLSDFITELDRYRPGILRCDPAVADLHLTGAYPLDDPDRILRALEQTLPVRVSGRSRYWLTVTAR